MFDIDSSLHYKFVGSRYAGNDEENQVEKAEHYNLFDLTFSKSFDNLSFKGSINNLTGEKYYSTMTSSSSNDAYVYPMPGRTFHFELNYKF